MDRMTRRGVARALPIWSTCLSILLGACGEDNPVTVGPDRPDTIVHSIRVLPPERTIGILGTRVEVGAEALAADGEVLYGSTLSPEGFSWSTSAPEVVELDEGTLLLTGTSDGTATITATSRALQGTMTVTVREQAHLEWSGPVGTGWVEAGIAIGAGGMIYIVSSQLGSTSRLTAMSSEGGEIWSVLMPFRAFSTPAIGPDGTLYLGAMSTSTFAGRLTAVDAGGAVRWVLDDIDGIRSSPALGPNGTIYVAGGRSIYAVDPLGAIQWTYEVPDEVFFLSSPAVASDGTIYVGGEDHLLYAIHPDGSLRWTFEAGDRIRSSPSVGPNDVIYFGALDGRLYAVRPDGTSLWSVELDQPGRGVKSSPSIGPDGTIYVVADDVVAIDPGGSIRWTYPSAGGAATAILGADGTVYVTGGLQGTGGDAIYALDADGGLLWDYRTGAYASGSPAIGTDGAIIAASFSGAAAASFEGAVHALVEHTSTNGGFQGSPWPQERGNRANTGRGGG